MATESKVMTKTDRNELRKIVKNRFTFLNEALETRYREVRAEIEQTIRDSHKAKADEYHIRAKKIQSKISVITGEWNELLVEAGKDGLTSDQGFLNAFAHGQTPLFHPKDLRSQVEDRMGDANVNIHSIRRELSYEAIKLDEELVLEGLASDEAKKFLEKIPSLEKLIPAPNGKPKGIEAKK